MSARLTVRGVGALVRRGRWVALGSLLAVAAVASVASADHHGGEGSPADGKGIFRFDTFGDEQFWTGQLRMNQVIEQSIDPQTALSLGLRVDVNALPKSLKDDLAAGRVDLKDPATTVALIELNAVVGVKGKVKTANGGKHLESVGITCAVCHSTVDDSFAPGIGRRLDGWPNRALDPGAIIAASPAVPDKAKAVYRSWGPGKYDPRFNIDGLSTPTVIPPAYGLAGVKKATYTADGDIRYWNDYVAVTQMGGQGVFIDPRIGVRVVRTPDLVHPKLGRLKDYEVSLKAPPPPRGSFDVARAAAGKVVFNGAGRCATCHLPQDHFTDVNRGVLHDPAETGMDPGYANRSATKKYRTTPLRALWQHAPYFHDGSARTLEEVVGHYDSWMKLGLNDAQKAALVEYLKTL